MVLQLQAKADCEVLVVGAGPSGLLTTLLLAQSGIDVILLEALPDIDNSPRAMAYGPSAVIELERAGVAAEARSVGMDPDDHLHCVRWIDIDGKVIGEFLPEDRVPYQLAQILKRRVCEYPNAEVRQRLGFEMEEPMFGNDPTGQLCKILTSFVQIIFDHRLVNIQETADKSLVTATLDTPAGSRSLSAQYLAGCDGGRSTVRKLLGMTYDGFTLPQWLVACNVRYPFQEHGFTRAQFVVHPEHFCLIGRIDPTGLWRVSYAEKDHLTREEVLANVHTKFEALFPGPKPLSKEDYQLEAVSPYRIHQRSAPAYRKGRSFLVGDAAHACAPFGGMGLTTGICDAAGLADTLVGVLRHIDPKNSEHPSSETLLAKYDEIRRQKYHEITHKVSYTNTCRLRDCSPDPERAVQEDEFFKLLNSGSEARRKLLESAYALGHDFKQYWPVSDALQDSKSSTSSLGQSVAV